MSLINKDSPRRIVELDRKSAVVKSEMIGKAEHVDTEREGKRTQIAEPEGDPSADASPGGITNAGRRGPNSTLRAGGFFQFGISANDVAEIRASGDQKAMISAMHEIAHDRVGMKQPERVTRFAQLLDGMSAAQIDTLRAAYAQQHGVDPEVHIRSWNWLQPLTALSKETELEMVSILRGPELKDAAATLKGLLGKAQSGTLTYAEREHYFAMMPMIGLWAAPTRGGADLDAMERRILKQHFGNAPALDDALKLIESKMPSPDLSTPLPRDKCLAAIVSSAGAQWQELMEWALVMEKNGYHVQLFTPDGRPAGFQHDSMCLSKNTAPFGFGCPPYLDPKGETGALAKKLLANSAGAARFDASKFGGVYVAGGLGFNEDAAFAEPDPARRGHAKLTANPQLASMMKQAIDARLPQIAICHGPTLYAAVEITVNGRTEKLAKGLDTASLPPFEGFVGLTQRKEEQFTYDVNTHRSLEDAGANTNVAFDIAKMDRVVKDEKDGMAVITGPGPLAAKQLANATIDALKAHWA